MINFSTLTKKQVRELSQYYYGTFGQNSGQIDVTTSVLRDAYADLKGAEIKPLVLKKILEEKEGFAFIGELANGKRYVVKKVNATGNGQLYSVRTEDERGEFLTQTYSTRPSWRRRCGSRRFEVGIGKATELLGNVKNVFVITNDEDRKALRKTRQLNKEYKLKSTGTVSSTALKKYVLTKRNSNLENEIEAFKQEVTTLANGDILANLANMKMAIETLQNKQQQMARVESQVSSTFKYSDAANGNWKPYSWQRILDQVRAA